MADPVLILADSAIDATGQTSLSIPGITVPSASSRYMAVITVQTGTPSGGVASVEYDGTPLDEILDTEQVATYFRLNAHQLIAPAIGTGDIDIEMNSAGYELGAIVVLLHTVHQTTPTGTPVHDNSEGFEQPELDVPSDAGKLVLDFIARFTATLEPDASQEELINRIVGGAMLLGASGKAGANPEVTMLWADSGGGTVSNWQTVHAALSINGTGGGSAPTLTDVDTDETFASNATAVPFTCTNGGADETARTLELVQGAVEVEQTQGSGNATGGTFDVVGFGPGGLLKYGVSTVLRITTAEGSDEMAVTINPPSGYAYVDLVSIHSDPDERVSAIPDLEAGNQLEYETLGGDVEVFDDATFEAPSAFDVRAFDDEWGVAGTQSPLGQSGDLTAGGVFGATFSAKASARASLTAGVGAGSSDTGDTDSSGTVAVPVTVTAIAAALAQARDAVAAGLAAGESWAGHAATAAVLAAGGAFGVAFEAETSAAEDGALTAGTSAAAAFMAAAATIDSLAPGATLGMVVAAIASTGDSLTAPAQLGLIAAALIAAQAAIAAGVSLGEAWAGHADTAASMAAAGQFTAAFVGETQSAQVGAVTAGTQAAAAFASAAAALGSLTLTSNLAAALMAIASTSASVTDVAAQFGASFNAQTQSTQEGVVDAPAGAGVQFASVAQARALLVAAGSLGAALAAFSSTSAVITAAVALGATFDRDGAEILPPAKATLRVQRRITTLRIPPRLRRLRTH